MAETRTTQRCATYVCDWLPPAFGAVGQYMMPVARQAAAADSDVVLIGLGREQGSSDVSFPGTGRLQIVRIAAGSTPKSGLLRRGLWAMSINLRLIWATHLALRGRDKGDLVVTGSPPFLSSLMILINRLVWRQRLIYRITDFYPETVLASGQAAWLRYLAPVFKSIRNMADEIEVLGRDQQRRLLEDGIPSDKIKLVRDGSPVEITPDLRPLPAPFSPDDRILLYSGNLGVAHPVAAFCEAYRRHVQSGSNRVRLWVNGVGARLPELIAYCKSHDLPLHLSGPVPLDQLGRLLVTPDAHLILLGESYWGYVLPSKIYGSLASGKPILFVGPDGSDVALLLRETGDPRHVQTLDVQACYEFLETLGASTR